MILLKCGIQDIDRITPRMKVFELVRVKFSSSEDVFRRDVLGIGYVVLNIYVVTSCHWPEVWINVIFPEKGWVKHHGEGNFIDRYDWPFSYTILMMCVDFTIKHLLIMITNVLNKTVFFVDIMISKISVNHNTMIQAHL